ncbi:DEAD/DEAH box helicase [Undibacterium terreum]|uniref:RNA helicase n=1 Tax=Undibacterium terreum TaxID=1224302 RepID=A0A916U8A3_9BURK|nr:DEAD/DEAH box helicase [Undibacterium terreum]GGC63439.1 RNA helicase [Undibacterium terreum]
MPFSSLGLIPPLLQAVSDLSYATPTAIQSAAIPAILSGADLLGLAQTGSGKTAAFALPLLQRLQGKMGARPRVVQALVLVPTRELAVQVGDALKRYAQHLPQQPRIATVFGGVSINPQMMALRGGTDIVVATPGRLLDLIDHNALSIGRAAMLVLDEADRLLDLGFADEINRILSLLPPQRQNLFFSATFPAAVETLANGILSQPVRLEVEGTPEVAPDIAQSAIMVDTAKRTPLLRHLLQEHDWKRVLVFVATKYAAELVADKLRRNGIQAEPFHGELSQGKRTQVLMDLKASRLQVMVATDVAARGIDIAGLPAVINYDLPRSVTDYTHRIGRTGRAGQSGTAISFYSADTEAHLRLIENRLKLKLVREQIPGFEPAPVPQSEAAAALAEAQANGGIKGKRKSKKDKLREAAAQQAKS